MLPRARHILGILGWMVVGFHLGKLTGLTINLSRFPTLGRRPPASNVRRTALLIPARNEARTLDQTLPTLLAQPADELLLLDDNSTDDTAEVARRHAVDDRRLRVLDGRPLPSGWTGKNWACHQLAAAAETEFLVFCDADVSLQPGALNAIHTENDAQQADLFSVFPRQHTVSIGERFLVPLIDDILLSFLPHPLLRLPIPGAATANGQVLAISREGYRALGGHASVAGAIVEDLELAKLTRKSGRCLGLALGGALISTRMYESYTDAVRGFGRGLRSVHGGSRTALLFTAAWHLLAYSAPWLCWRSGPQWRAAACLALVHRVLLNIKTGRVAPAEALLVPLTPLAALSVYRDAWRSTASWKGRDYPTAGSGSAS